MERLRVTVTRRHIATGSKKSCFDCPIAYALIDAMFPVKYRWATYRKASVAETIKIQGGKLTHYAPIEIPDDIKEWIIKFDKGEKVYPFSFVIQQSSYYPSVPNCKISLNP